MKSSIDREAASELPDADPGTMAVAEAAGLAQWLRASDEIATTGNPAASRLGQVSWAMFEWARNPYILLVWIYLFTPYFANYVVPAGYCGPNMPRGACGQGIAGVIQAYSGIFIAILAPFLGAIADRGGRRKPWVALYAVILAARELHDVVRDRERRCARRVLCRRDDRHRQCGV